MGPLRADMLKKELNIFTFRDLLEHFPYRHIDKTKVSKIRDIQYNTDFIQVAGRVTQFQITGQGRARRLVAEFRDDTGMLELVFSRTPFQIKYWKIIDNAGRTTQVSLGNIQLNIPLANNLFIRPSAPERRDFR